MKKNVLSSLVSAGVLALAPEAMAQCAPGSWLCANVNINAGATVQVGTRPVVQPQVVVYQPPPPVVVYQPPRTTIVTIRPVQQPVQVYVPPPPPVRTVTTTTTITVNTQSNGGMLVRPFWQRDRVVGLGMSFLGATMGANDYTTGRFTSVMGGFSGHLRVRTRPWFAAEFALGYVSGTDYQGDSRQEIPFTVNGLFYLNPMSRFQVYLLAGVGYSSANVESSSRSIAPRPEINYGYLGGDTGLGLELWVSPHFALHADARAFLRSRIDGRSDTNPEFTRAAPGGTGSQSTNTSTGLLFQAGATIYF